MISEQNVSPENINSQDIPTSKLSWLKNRLTILGMIVISTVLLIPLLIFTASSNKNPPRQNEAQVENDIQGLFTGPYVSDELIIQYKETYTYDEIQNLKAKLEKVGVVKQEKAFEGDEEFLKNYYLLTFKPGTDLKKVAKELANLKEIKSLHPNYIFEADEIPNDSLYPQMWGLLKIEAPSAWDLTHGSNSVKIAVIDTGIDYTHQDFQGRTIIRGEDFSTCDAYSNTIPPRCIAPKSRDNDPFDDNGHGTHVAGIIGAVTNNTLGIAGVNWDVTLMAVKTMGKSRYGDFQDVMDGLRYAIDNGARIINISLDHPQKCSIVSSLQAQIDDAISRGIVIVAAAGNGGSDNIGDDAANTSPASCNGVIAVGASDQSDKRPTFSNRGTRVDIAAPGTSIYSLAPNNSYGTRSGTSMASPHVAGVVGLLLGVKPGLSVGQVRTCLVDNGDVIFTDYPIGPRLNAFKTLNSCSGFALMTPSPSPTIATSPTITTNPRGATPTAVVSSPIPLATYTCRERSPVATPPPGTIKIGDLECVPN